MRVKNQYHEVKVHECTAQEYSGFPDALDCNSLVDTNDLDVLQFQIKDIAQEGAANATYKSAKS